MLSLRGGGSICSNKRAFINNQAIAANKKKDR